VAPEQVHVQVFNAAGVAGLGARADADLRRAGFATTGAPSNAPVGTAGGRTVIRYDPRWAESARTLSGALPEAELTPVPGLGPTLQVYAGGDYPAAASPPPASPPLGSPPPASPSLGARTVSPSVVSPSAAVPPAPTAQAPGAGTGAAAADTAAGVGRASDIICP
ncbi:LytR C-terminal domain-containing protein, partial [Kitasatospora sp. NPDC001574]